MERGCRAGALGESLSRRGVQRDRPCSVVTGFPTEQARHDLWPAPRAGAPARNPKEVPILGCPNASLMRPHNTRLSCGAPRPILPQPSRRQLQAFVSGPLAPGHYVVRSMLFQRGTSSPLHTSPSTPLEAGVARRLQAPARAVTPQALSLPLELNQEASPLSRPSLIAARIFVPERCPLPKRLRTRARSL